MRRRNVQLELYRPARAMLAAIIHTYFRVRYEGRANVPAQGGCVIAANHMSYIDPPLVGVACPRQINFMAKAELFKIPVLRWFMPRIKAFPVHRGASDRQAIRRALTLLSQGEVVGVFPEGTRNRSGGDLLPPQGGAAMLALKAGVPVVPAAVWGTSGVAGIRWPHTARVGVRFGTPLRLPPVDNVNKENVAEASQQIMAAIKKLIAETRSPK